MDAALPDDYLSPRSKVAKLLEEIDEAPTPSPQRSEGDLDQELRTDTQKSRALQSSPPCNAAPSRQRSIFEEDNGSSSGGDGTDDESLPVRPLGRIARRMLQPTQTDANSTMPKQHDFESDHDDLYTMTPVKTSESRATNQTRSQSPSVVLTLRSPQQASLFVSPRKSPEPPSSDNDDDLPDNPLLGMTARGFKRRKLQIAKRAGQQQASSPQTLAMSSEPGENSDDDPVNATNEKEMEKILSDASRPTRKASKKALLEMERETQRLAREQALAHQIKVKKKFTTNDLFARFNFRQVGNAQEQSPQRQDGHYSSSPARSSVGTASRDHATREPVSTPPSTPPTPWDAQKAMVDRGALAKMVPVRQDSLASIASNEEDTTMPDTIGGERLPKRRLFDAVTGSPSKSALDKGKTRITSRLMTLPSHIEDDDELDILQPMPAHLQMFDRVKPVTAQRETHSKALHVLKHLAHLNHYNTSSSKKNPHTVVDPVVLNAQLIARAKGHARKAQQDRLEELKAKGIVIMSAEEQEKDAEELEDLLEKARQEAQELRKKERAAAKKTKDDAEEVLAVASDDEDEDADWNEEADDREEADELDADDESDSVPDAAAEESEGSDSEEIHDQDDADADAIDEASLGITMAKDDLDQRETSRRHRKLYVIEDDEDDEVAEITDALTTEPTVLGSGQAADATEEVDPFAAFGFGSAKPAFDFMSPTQAFNATMQTPSQYTRPRINNSPSIHAFDESPLVSAQLPTTSQPLEPQVLSASDEQSQLVPASQLAEDTQPVRLLWETQMPETPVPALKEATSNLTETPGWEPSQDAGLPMSWTAARRRQHFSPAAEDEEDHDTQSTVRMRISESPEVVVPQRKGRLNRGVRHHSIAGVSQEEPVVAHKTKNAFTEMQKRQLDGLDAAQRAEVEREMRNMMDEQAEESEDEYAGLGGDDSNMIAPETAEDRAMIDESNIEVGEDEAREMAKFFAKRQRAAEEEATSKLYKDLTTGALRRRQGAGWELDEDEDEVAARRRQIRQREEARKRRLLLQDENVKNLLEGKGNTKGREAFLRTMGDDDDNDDQDDTLQLSIDETVQQSSGEGQSQASDAAVVEATQPLQEISPNKRPRDESDAQQARPATKLRRTHVEEAVFTRPTSMLQVRESLSFLLDDPSYPDLTPPTTDYGSDEGQDEDEDDIGSEIDGLNAEEEELARQNDGGYAPNPDTMESQAMPPPPLPTTRLPASQRRTPAVKSAVVDRLSLRRGSSSSSNSSNSTSWSAWSTGSNSTSKKVPSLLRRATSNLSNASNANEHGVSYSNGASNANDRGVSIGSGSRAGGSKKSSLAYQARAEERRVLLERSERKRIDGRRKMAEIRRQQGGALATASFSGGQWE